MPSPWELWEFPLEHIAANPWGRRLGDRIRRTVDPRGEAAAAPVTKDGHSPLQVNPVKLLLPHISVLRDSFRDPRICAMLSFQDLYVGLSPYNAPGGSRLPSVPACYEGAHQVPLASVCHTFSPPRGSSRFCALGPAWLFGHHRLPTSAGAFSLLAATELRDGVWYPMGGWGTVGEALRELTEGQGVTIRTGSRVNKVLVRCRRPTHLQRPCIERSQRYRR